jgi:hypothetical protein
MNIIFVYNKENEEYVKLVKDIENEITKKLIDFNIKYFTKNSINSKLKKDIIIIISDDLKETDQYLSEIKNFKKTILLTNNLSSEYILSVGAKCANICYRKISIEEIVKRVYRVYIDNKE